MSHRPPDFIIAGAAKSATTWLQNSLQASAQVFMPDHEPHFFSRAYQSDLTPYWRLFEPAPPGALLGEKSNSYLTEPGAETRLHRHLPGLPLVFQLRDPVARAYSDYCMLYRRGSVDGDIARHLDPDRAARGRFLRDSCYAAHLNRFRALWPDSALLVLLYEDIATHPERQLQRLADHVGLRGPLAPPLPDRVKDARAAAVPRPLRRALRPLRPFLDPIRHHAPMRALRACVARPHRYPALEPSLRAELTDFFRPHITALANLPCAAGLDLSRWSG